MGQRALTEGKPLGHGGFVQEGKPVSAKEMKKITLSCECGFHGSVGELLVIDDDAGMFCPNCGSPGWIYD